MIDRGREGFAAATETLMNHLYEFTKLTRRQRIEMRNRVERMAGRFDWQNLASHYHEAHDVALGRLVGTAPRRGGVEVRAV